VLTIDVGTVDTGGDTEPVGAGFVLYGTGSPHPGSGFGSAGLNIDSTDQRVTCHTAITGQQALPLRSPNFGQ